MIKYSDRIVLQTPTKVIIRPIVDSNTIFKFSDRLLCTFSEQGIARWNTSIEFDPKDLQNFNCFLDNIGILRITL